MVKTDAMAEALAMINEHKTLLPGTHDYDVVAEQVSLLIDQLGQEKALKQIQEAKSHLLDQIKLMCK